MNVSKISEVKALSEGAELWVIRNDPGLLWWSKLDFNSHFLLSQVFFKAKSETPEGLQSIIQATSMAPIDKVCLQNHVLLGTQDHFLNKWILLWNGSEAALVSAICDSAEHLKYSSVRLFSHSREILKGLEARPTASSLTITYIENI